MKRHLSVILTVLLAIWEPAHAEDPPVVLARPTPEQLVWHDMEIEMFVCLDPCTWQNRECDNHSTPLAKINPKNLDTDQWCRVAKSFGARQILFVAKHCGGFCWWQTETNEYSVKNTPWRDGKGDVLADLAESCRKYGLKLAIYICPRDDSQGAGNRGITRDPSRQEAYNKVYRQQWTEVLSRYGTISEVWFDGSCIVPLGDILKKYAPNAMVLQSPHTTLRWCGNESGYVPYPAWNALKSEDAKTGVATAAHGDPDGDAWLPLEVDTVNVHPHWWFWKSSGRRLRTTDELMRIYYQSVGRGAVLLLNSTPDTTGLIPEEDVRQYAAFGAEIRRRFDASIAETTGRGELVELVFDKPVVVNHVVTMEEIREGERVRAYVLEGFAKGTWQQLAEGISIGHKRIDSFPPVEVLKVRLRVTKSAAEPLIRRLAAFEVQGIFPDRIAATDWHFDEGRGDTVRDSTGDLVGKVSGPMWDEGIRGKALDFDGKDDYVSLGNADIYDQDFTITAWIRPRSFPTRLGVIVAKERNGVQDYNFRFYVAPDGKLGFWISDAMGNNVWPFETPPGSVSAGQWTFVAVTRSGKTHTLYINGKKVAAKSSIAVIRHCNMLDLRVGGCYASASGNDRAGDSVFDGTIDEVHFYTRALSDRELANE